MNTLERYSSTIALLIVVGTFAAAALISAVGRIPQEAATPTPALSSFVMVIATAQPTVQPTADTTTQETIARLEQRVAELEAERNAPEPQAVIMVQAAPTQPPAPTPEPVQLQTFVVQSDEEPLSPALLREAQDQ